MSSVSWALKSRTPPPFEPEIPPCASSTELMRLDIAIFPIIAVKSNKPTLAPLQLSARRLILDSIGCSSAMVHRHGGCRPLLGLDGSHLKNKYKGVCLTLTLSLTHVQVSCFLPLV